MSSPTPLSELLPSRIEELEQNIRKLRVVISILITFVVLFIIGLMIPELLGALALLGFIAVIGGGMVCFISAIMGLLEWWSPSGHLDEKQSTADVENLATRARS